MTDNDLSVVVRCTQGEPLDALVGSIEAGAHGGKFPEVVVVATGPPRISELNRRRVGICVTPAKRIEAKAIGVAATSSSKVLFLDSDQFLSETLLDELALMPQDMILIPERSRRRTVFGAVLDSRRAFVEGQMKVHPDVRLAVVPRCFKRSVIHAALSALPERVVREVTETEDSLIFHECLKLTSQLEWTKSYILNDDPDLFTFMRKSFRYGYRNESAIRAGSLPPEYVALIRQIQAASALKSSPGPMGSVVSRILRGVPYLAGTLSARLGL